MYIYFDSIIKRYCSVDGNPFTDEIRGRYGYPIYSICIYI